MAASKLPEVILLKKISLFLFIRIEFPAFQERSPVDPSFLIVNCFSETNKLKIPVDREDLIRSLF